MQELDHDDLITESFYRKDATEQLELERKRRANELARSLAKLGFRFAKDLRSAIVEIVKSHPDGMTISGLCTTCHRGVFSHMEVKQSVYSLLSDGTLRQDSLGNILIA